MRLRLGAIVAGLAVGSACGGHPPTGFGGDPGGGSIDASAGGDAGPLNLGGGGGPSPTIGYVITLEDGGTSRGAACPTGAYTTISGKIYDPAGKNPLYGAVAYVPSKPLSAFKPGVSCDSCGSLYSGAPVAAGQTDAAGHFVIPNAPSGDNVPLVVQLGKWRMTYTLPRVTPCRDNPQADGTLRLPHNHSVGDIPNIAVSTGGADTLECLLSRMGLDASEYTGGPGGPGRIHVFAGGVAGSFFGFSIGTAPNTSPPGPASSAALWDSAADIDAYDIVLLSCEGNDTYMPDQQVLFDYAKAGGRVFASHFHYAWFDTGPFSTAASLATWETGSNAYGTSPTDGVDGVVRTTLASGAAFPKGVAMKTWLGNVHALGVGGAPPGEIPIVTARHNANVTGSNLASTSWIEPDPSAGQSAGTTLYFSFNTPLGAASESQCGRVVYSDLHVGGGSTDTGGTIPGECAAGDLSPQEKALEFMLYDLSACVVPDDAPPPALNIAQ